MYTQKLFLFILLILGFFCIDAGAQGFLKSEGKRIVNDDGEILLRGMGLGGWILQEPYMMRLSGVCKNQSDIKKRMTDLIGEEKTADFYKAWIRHGVQKADIDSLAAWGFNSVRLPMHYNIYTLPVNKEPDKNKNTWLEEGFILTDSLLSWCEANKLYLILDLHAAPGGQGNDIAISDASDVKLWNSAENKKKTVDLWRKLAERYKDEEWIGGYDILNEPNWGFIDSEDMNGCKEELNKPLLDLYKDITKAIREVDKNHIIIISGNCWGNNYNGIFPLWDDNMVVSFHKYWNYNKQPEIEHFVQFREDLNAPLWMSESGENSNTWHRDAIKLLEDNNIGWCWWNYKKLRLNCPMEIIPNEKYKRIIAFWEGKADRLSENDAYEGLMRLAESSNIANTVFHRDYIDALFRQVRSDETKPYKNNVLKKDSPLIIFATDFDLGRNSYSFWDKDSANYRTSTGKNTSGNKGSVYRNDAVDIEISDDSQSNGYNVYSIESGEWLQYTVDVDVAGQYRLALRIKEANGEGKIQPVINGKKYAIMKVPQGASGWSDIIFDKVSLKRGTNNVRVYFPAGGFKFSLLKIE